MAENSSGFWSTLPGVLTGIAALITSVGGIYFAVNRTQTPAAQTVPAANTSQPARLTGAEPVAEAQREAELRATVVDPDGWTNMRSGPSQASDVVARVDEGEIFWTRPQDGKWWPVRMAGGQAGYIHRSRIRLNP